MTKSYCFNWRAAFFSELSFAGSVAPSLAADPTLAAERARHRAQLDAWMQAQGDRGQATEMAALAHMQRYVEDPTAGGGAAKKKAKK